MRMPGGTARVPKRLLTLDTINAPKRALLLENIHPDAVARLTKAGYQVETRGAARSARTS